MRTKKKIGVSINIELVKELDNYCLYHGLIKSIYIEKAIKKQLEEDKKNEESKN